MKSNCIVFIIAFVAFGENSVIGSWTTYDDKTGKISSIIKIHENRGKIFGYVKKIYNEPDTVVCGYCKGDLHNKKILGLQIIREMEKSNGEWLENGFILDPNNGIEYRCKMRLLKDHDKLEVRGFVGLSLLGRSQVWIRTKE